MPQLWQLIIRVTKGIVIVILKIKDVHKCDAGLGRCQIDQLIYMRNVSSSESMKYQF